MTLPGETIGTGASMTCSECKNKVSPLKVCHSGAGYYIGTICSECGPYTRESVEYYHTEEAAQFALDNKLWTPRDTEFHG
jgi:ribosomal protein L44E